MAIKYKVKQEGKKWAIVRISDNVTIDSWDEKRLAERRLEAINELNCSWGRKNGKKT